MKQKWFVSSIGVVILAIAATVFTGCTSPAGSDGSIRLQFNEQRISVEDSSGKNIASGDVVTQGQTIKFTAKILREKGVVKAWHIGTKTLKPPRIHPTAEYSVDAKDGNRYQLITVDYEQE